MSEELKTFVFEKFTWLEHIKKEDLKYYDEYLRSHPEAKIKEDKWYKNEIYSLFNWKEIWDIKAESRRQAIKKFMEVWKISNINGFRVRKK